MKTFKRILSLSLAVLMVMSLFTVMGTAFGAVTYENTKLYFDVSTTGWTMGSKDKVGFYIYGDGFEPIAWGGKKLNGVDEGDGIWSYDPASKGTTLEEGVQYKIIFTGGGQQTADLFFDTTCFGHCAYCNGEMIENTVDSSKKSQVALWKDLDPAQYGPVKGITSLGNLVGTCLPQGVTDEMLFTNWLTDTGAQGYANAMKYTVEPGTKTEQQLIDDLAGALNLTKEFVQESITAAGIESAWSADASTLPGEVVLDPNKLYFDASGTGWELGAKDKVGFYVYGKDGELIPWGGKKLNGTDEGNGLWSYDPAAKGMNIVEGEQYAIIFTGAGNQTYDLLFDTNCFGHVAYCDGTMYENPVDSSKQAQAAFWKDLDATMYGPKLQISSVGTVVGTCLEAGATAESVFTNFLTNTLANAREFKVDTGEMTEQQLIDGIGTDLGLTKQQVYDAFAATGVESTWDYTVSTLPGEVVIPHTHTPGEPVRENEIPATCTAAGSYDEVVYCTDCKEELSREPKTIEKLAHTPGEPVRENEIPATCTAAGSYDEVVYCTECKAEISREPKTIEKLAHTPGEPVRENEIPATCTAAGSYDEVVYCTECKAEISRETGKVIPAAGHKLEFVEQVAATVEAEGTKAHYKCSVCSKLFDAEDSTKEVTAEELVIAKLEPVTEPETQPVTEPETEPVTEPETQPVPELTDGYYLVGTFCDWAPNAEYKMTLVENGNYSGKYVFKGLVITATTGFKVVMVDGETQTWIPDGMGNNYGENGEITVPGVYDVYFDPAIASEGWFYNCIYVDGMPAPTQPVTEPSTEPVDDRRPIEKMAFADDVVAEAGITDTFTVYFQMPMDGEINWANEYNELNGQNYAGVYWWQGAKNLDPWPGAKMTLVDAEQGIFSVNVPYEPDVLTTIIFNNAVDGGQDKTAPQYSAAHQTANLNVQGYEEGESDTIPEGTAADNFDGCIFIIDPNTLDVNQFSGKDTIDGDWYVYYGDGHYGCYAQDSDKFVSVEENCMNPAHDHGHDIPTQPTEPVTEPVPGEYYIVGNMTGWAPKEEYKMTETEDGFYTYEMNLDTSSQFKVVYVQGDKQTWLPDGMGNNYGENGEITEAGVYTITFDSNINSEGWFYNCIKADLKPAQYKLGDVDGDGEVTITDATFIQRYATKINVPFSESEMMKGDVDGDGEVTITDATFIQRYATRADVPYPVGEVVNG